jgi:hypothetical protein
MTTVE